MATEILEVGATAAQSTEIVLADGEAASVHMKGQTGPDAKLIIQVNDDADAWHNVGPNAILSPAKTSLQINGPGTYRLDRPAGATCGAYRG